MIFFERSSLKDPLAVFSRGLGLVYVFAFGSLFPQILGLFGSDGIAPAHLFLRNMPLSIPTLFHLNASDFFLQGVCILGVLGGLALFLQFYSRVMTLLLWVLFLSLVNVGTLFLQYQWEALLLEVGFLACFLNIKRPNRWVVLLLWFLLFRLLFMSGLSKVLSGDPYWRSFTATAYHFESQPLPTVLAWAWHQAPMGFHQLSCGVMFFMEMVLPFLIWGKRPYRLAAFLSAVLLQLGFILTGNFGYFNYLCLVLAIPLLTDLPSQERTPSQYLKGIFFLLLFLMSLSHVWIFGPVPLIDKLNEWTANFHLTSNYGLFAVMTTGRKELFIEGSHDKKEWKTYRTKYKPDDPSKRPPWIAPHQPRLDWQLWFSALTEFRREHWLTELLTHLFQNSEGVLKLFEENPFPHEAPRYLRIQSKEYRFSTLQEWKEEGIWWKVSAPVPYSPEFELKRN